MNRLSLFGEGLLPVGVSDLSAQWITPSGMLFGCTDVGVPEGHGQGSDRNSI